MIRKLIPERLRRWLWARIRQILRQDFDLATTRDTARLRKTLQRDLERSRRDLKDGRISLPVSAVKYRPHDPEADSFVIPNQPQEHDTCDHGIPIPPRKLWLGYGQTEEQYLSSGASSVDKMLATIESSGYSFASGGHILDFGCGAGRMIRHLKGLAEVCEIWGVDIRSSHIYWCRQQLEPPFRFATTTTIPHLPFEDRYFGLIYAASVFTHIDDMAEAWLLELRRVLSEEGRLYITVHDNHTIKLLETTYSHHKLAKRLQSSTVFNESKEDFGMLAIGRDASSLIFYDEAYFRKMVRSMGYKVVAVEPGSHDYQTAWLLRKSS